MTLTILTPEFYPVPAVLGGAVSDLVSEYAPMLATPSVVVSPAHSGLAGAERLGPRSRVVRVVERRRARRHLDQLLPRRFRALSGSGHLAAALDAIPPAANTIVVENRPWFGLSVRARFPGARIVLHQHNVLADPHEDLAAFDAVVAVSHHLRGHLVDRTGRTDTAVVHNGITPPATGPGRRAAPDRPTVLFVGRLVPEKGAHRVLDAVPALRDAVPDVRVRIAGSAAFGRATATVYERGLRARAASLGDTVEWLGFVPPRDMAAVWAAADVFCAPGQWEEPFGLVYLEAQAHGVPVVGTAVGGVPEVVESGVSGTLLDPGASPEDIADACVRLLEDDALPASFVAAGRERVTSYFDWRHRATDLERELTGTPVAERVDQR